MESEVHANPTNFQNLLSLASIYLQMQQTNRAIELFDRAMENPHLDPGAAGYIAQAYAQMGNLTKLEAVIEKLVTLAPNQPEPVYDLAALDAVLGKQDLALENLRKSLELSAERLKANPTARDLSIEVQKDHRFDGLRNLPAFQQISPSH
jgi:tetratricopeptide (TPR) repeat protein